MIVLRSSLGGIGLAALVSLTMLHAGVATAEDAPPPQAQPTPAPGLARPGPGGNRAASTPNSPSTAEQHKLPPDSTTKQTVELPGRTLAFTATAGSIRLFDDKGEPQADIAYTSYQLDGIDRAKRPVTFLFNGGPGASSAYLQLGNAVGVADADLSMATTLLRRNPRDGDAAPLLDQAEAIYGRAGYRKRQADCLLTRGQIAKANDDPEKARSLSIAGLEIYSDIPAKDGIASSQVNLATLALKQA